MVDPPATQVQLESIVAKFRAEMARKDGAPLLPNDRLAELERAREDAGRSRSAPTRQRAVLEGRAEVRPRLVRVVWWLVQSRLGRLVGVWAPDVAEVGRRGVMGSGKAADVPGDRRAQPNLVKVIQRHERRIEVLLHLSRLR